MGNDNTRAIREAVESFFERDDAKYRPFDEDNVARAGYGLRTKFRHVDAFFRAHKDKLVIRMILPISVDEEDRAKVAEFLHRANYGLMIGNFDFDFRDGEISYRVAIYCGDEDFEPPTYEQINFAVVISLMMIQKYGDALIKVVFGLLEAEEAIDSVESAD